MIFRLAEKKDAWQIAEIHQREIKKGFLRTLSNKFLAKIYLAIVSSKYSFCIIAEEDQEIKGFVAGITNLSAFRLYFLKRYFFSVLFSFFPLIFNFRKIKKLFEVLFYPKKEKELTAAELLTIAVKSEFRGKGIAGQMLERFISEMKNREVDSFKVIVGEVLLSAVKFYEKSGFKFVKNINVHKDNVSRVYIYQIK